MPWVHCAALALYGEVAFLTASGEPAADVQLNHARAELFHFGTCDSNDLSMLNPASTALIYQNILIMLLATEWSTIVLHTSNTKNMINIQIQ